MTVAISESERTENGVSHSDDLVALARSCVEKHPNSDIEVAMAFLEQTVPKALNLTSDQLVKAGRNIVSLISLGAHIKEGLELLIRECSLLMSGQVKVPTVRFGKTGLDMPIVTLGCMRFQQQWGPTIKNMNMVHSICQGNLDAILKRAVVDFGINHIETARAYGSSELQLGTALKKLYATTHIRREDLIIQVKVAPFDDPEEFRQTLETSFKNLKIDYADLMSVHGINIDSDFTKVFGNNGDNCMKVIQEYVDAGKIKHVGFSTHGPKELIEKCIKTDAFSYVNLHYHYFGSYTASAQGADGEGNLDNLKLLQEKDMGVFIISGYDKGGKLYAPSRKLRSLTLPDMEPMEFGSAWMFNHKNLTLENGEKAPPIHTFTVGAARPSDLDQPAVIAYLQQKEPEETLRRVQRTVERLEKAKKEALGEEWVKSWYVGLSKCDLSKNWAVEHNQLVWLYNCIKAFGMWNFAKDRYGMFVSNFAKWDDNLPAEENVKNAGERSWGWTPGIIPRPEEDYSDALAGVPAENMERVLEAEAFVKKWCEPKKKEESKDENGKDEAPKPQDDLVVPEEWKTAYDMKPWKDFPDQPYP